MLTNQNQTGCSTGAEPAVVSAMKISACLPAFRNQQCGRCGWPADCHEIIGDCKCEKFFWVKKHYEDAAIASYKRVARMKWQWWADHMLEDD